MAPIWFPSWHQNLQDLSWLWFLFGVSSVERTIIQNLSRLFVMCAGFMV
jgi:hypothetical protein